jgi:hypothetical protein
MGQARRKHAPRAGLRGHRHRRRGPRLGRDVRRGVQDAGQTVLRWAPQVRHFARLPGPLARPNILSSQSDRSVRPGIRENFCSGNSVILE